MTDDMKPERDRGVRVQRLVSLRRVIEYTACPHCSCWSLGVQANGRLVRHTMGIGYVERVGPGTRYPYFRPGKICPGSGKLVRKQANSLDQRT